MLATSSVVSGRHGRDYLLWTAARQRCIWARAQQRRLGSGSVAFALSEDLWLAVALELHSQQQTALQQFIASDGTRQQSAAESSSGSESDDSVDSDSDSDSGDDVERIVTGRRGAAKALASTPSLQAVRFSIAFRPTFDCFKTRPGIH